MKTKKRFHKLTAWLLTLAMLMTFIPSFTLTASAATEVYASGNLGQGNRTAWTIYDNGLLVIDGKGNSISAKWDSTTASPWKDYADIITRASFVNCENWVRIPENTFRGLSNLKEVILPENIEEICQYAFTGAALETIILPERLKTIGNYAFSSCESLNYININDGVTSIGSSAFYNCSSLKAISIPDSVTSIGQTLFQNCTNLEYVRLSENATKVGGSMFFGCTMLKNISLPATVTVIGSKAFSNASNLTGVYYHGTVEPTTYNPGLNNASFSLTPDTMVIYASNDYSGTTMGMKATWENDVNNVTKIDGYFVNMAHTVGGAVKVDKSIVPVGDTVTVDIMAYKNYVLDTFAVTGADGNDITVTGDSNTRTFSMPEGDVTITATFKSTIVPHVHSWTFEAEGTYINATCANTDGACHNPYQSVVITPPSTKYFAWNLERTVTVSGTIEDVEIPEVVYTLKSTGEEVRPFAPGVYVASLTIENTTLTYEYEITKSNQLNNSFFTYTAPENLTYDGTAKIATVVPNATVDAYIGDVEVLYNRSSTPPVTVGTYTVTLNVEESDYFTAKTNLALGGRGGQKFSIVAKDIEDLDYTGLAESYPVGATPDVTIKYNDLTLVKDTDYTLVHTNNTEPGTATITVTGIGNYTGTKTLEFEISAHDHSWTYTANGSTITAECSTADCPISSETLTISAPQHNKYGDGKDVNATLSVTKIGDFTVSNTDIVYTNGNETLTAAPTDAGTYKAIITVDTDKIAFVEYTIAKADAKIPTGLTSVYGRTLNNITLPDGWTWANSMDSVGNVGNQTHKANYAGDNNHNAASNVELTVTVSQSSASMTAYANKNEYTYGEPVTITVNGITPTGEAAVNLFSLTATTTNQVAIWNGDTQLTESQTVTGEALNFTVEGLGIGECTLTAKFTGNDNMAPTSASVTIVINKAIPNYTTPGELKATYGDTLNDVTLPTADNGVWSWASDGDSVGNAGTQSHSAIFTPNDTTNYEVVNVNVSVIVDKAVIGSAGFNVTTPEAGAVPQTAVTTGTGYSAEIAWNETAEKFGFNTAYTATVTLTADGNHKFADTLSKDGWTVALNNDKTVATFTKTFEATRKQKIESVTSPTNVNLDSHKSDAAAVIATLPTTVLVVLEENGTDNLAIEWSCANFNAAPLSENTFSWTATNTKYDNNNVVLTGTITVTNPESNAVSITVKTENTTVVYNAAGIDLTSLFDIDTNAGSATYTVTNGTGAGTQNGTALSVTKAGTFTVKVDTVANGIYAAGTQSATLTVEKANGTGTVSMGGWTYGETAKEPVVSDNKGAATYQYKVKGSDDSTYSPDKPSNAGEYTVKATFAESDLYKEATATDDFTIAKVKVAKPEADTRVFTYNKGEQTYTLTASDYYTITGNKMTNAGSQTVTVALKDKVNYAWTDGATDDVTFTFTIAKKSIEAATVDLDGTLTYTGAEQIQNVTVTLDGFTVTFDVADNKATNVKTDGNYTLKVTANGNFEGEKTLEWNITKATPAPNPEKVTTARVRRGQKLANATVTNGEFFALDGTTVLEGTFAWVDDTKEIIADSTEKMKFAPIDTNYAEIEIDVAVDSYTTGGGGSSSNTSTTTTKNEDGSTTKTTTNKSTGTKTEVTTNTDGSTTTVETKKDGTVTTTEKDKDGNTVTTVEKSDGTSTTTEKNKDGSEKVTEEKADGTTVTTEKDTDGTKTVTTEKADGSTTTEEVRKDGTEVKTETTTDGETTSEVKADGKAEVTIPVPDTEKVQMVVVTDENGNNTYITEVETNDDGVSVTTDGNATVSVMSGNKKEFVDVHHVDHWSEKSVDFVHILGLMNGTSENHFSPDVDLTRAMLVTVLYRAEGEPEMKNAQWFEDVEKGQWYSDAVAWATFNGITMGYGNGNFGPNDNITREQIVAIMHRYAQYKGYDVTQGGMLIREYSDYENISDYALNAMTWSVNIGMLSGRGNNNLAPQSYSTRAEVAAILERFIKAN